MRVTWSVLKADIGSVGGHTLPSPAVLAAVKEVVEEVKKGEPSPGRLRLPHRGRHRPPPYPIPGGWPTLPFTSSLSRPMVEVS